MRFVLCSFLFLLGACQKEDQVSPAEEAEYREVQGEVARLRSELEALRAKNSVADLPPVPVVVEQLEKGLEDSREELASLQSQRETLETEIKDLKAQAALAREQLEDYRKKYPLK